LPGPFDSTESRQAFARLQLEIEVSPVPSGDGAAGISVAEVLLAFLEFAVKHYVREDGATTDEVDKYKLTCRYVRELYADAAAAEFGPLALKAVRQKFVRCRVVSRFGEPTGEPCSQDLQVGSRRGTHRVRSVPTVDERGRVGKGSVGNP